MKKFFLSVVCCVTIRTAFCGNTVVSFFCSVDKNLRDTIHIVRTPQDMLLQNETEFRTDDIFDTLVGNTVFRFEIALPDSTGERLALAGRGRSEEDSSLFSFHFASQREANSYHSIFLYSTKVYGRTEEGVRVFPVIPIDSFTGYYIAKIPSLYDEEMRFLRVTALNGMAKRIGEQ